MKKLLTRIPIFLLMFSILCSCTNTEEASLTQADDEKTSPLISAESSYTSTASEVQQSENTAALTNSDGEIYATPIIITDSSGEQHLIDRPPMNKESLADFKYEKFVETVRKSLEEHEEKDYYYNGYSYIKGLGDPQLTEVFVRSKALAQICCNTEGFSGDIETELPEKNNYIYVYKEDYPLGYKSFSETGINFDSFYNAYCEIFTEDSVNKMLFETFPFYHVYNDELWVKYVSFGGGIWHSEIEYVKETDTEVEFDLICYAPEGGWSDSSYQDPKGEWKTTEFEPEKRNIYKSAKIKNHFIKTEDGWRAQEIEVMGISSLIKDKNFPEGFHDM
ncbi:MAG: hypothetical protein NC203_07865 [Firmicutes bacterium]|nr:hypothetical protein [[Eubacterium] siraeum]MCM1488265.1 hypothetical protein [Bacillota bacterium]